MNPQHVVPTILLATRNPGKLREFRALLVPAGWQIVGLADLAIGRDVEETGASFAENARLKALSFSNETDLPVLADDSGLEVVALGGRPGIESARYAGAAASDADRICKLLGELSQAEGSRAARFVCSLALAQWGSMIIEVEGECRGEIAAAPRGDHGFGYDPIFFVPELGQTLAELDESVKNEHSHRAHAVRALLAQLASR